MLHARLLGEQVITDGATGDVRTRSQRTLALLGLLALHADAPQSRQRIAGLFWPGSTDAQALTNLRRELHQLRRTLGDGIGLVVESATLCWQESPGCRVDVHVFASERIAAYRAVGEGRDEGAVRHGAAALGVYGGDLLPGCCDDWVITERDRLARECTALSDLVCQAGLRTGDLQTAEAAARRRIQLQPLEEVGYRSLMELQADIGDRSGAISTYHHCASVLENELGIDPDRATQAVFHRLLASDRGRPEQARRPPTGRRGVALAELTGRESDLARLREEWSAAASGSARVVIVAGDSGVGKTRLVAELASEVRTQGGAVAVTECFATSGRLGLAPVADWLRTAELRAATASLEPVWQAEVERLVPPSTSPAVTTPVSRAMVDAWQRLRFFEGVSRALTGVGRPLLLVLDNLQWCDQETLAVLGYCLESSTDSALMVAATLRQDDDGAQPGVREWIAHLNHASRLTTVPLVPLDPEDTTSLAKQLCGHRALDLDESLLHAVTGGFPLYVVEASRTDTFANGGPAADLDTVLRNRLTQVSPQSREVAALAAAVGRDFSLEVLTAASDLAPDAVVRAVDELWRHRIVRELQGGYDFSHDLMRDSAYTQVGRPQQWLMHRRLAQALELVHANHLDDVAAQMAEQYEQGDVPERALHYYRRAAEMAVATFAHSESIRFYRKARSLVSSLPGGRNRDALELGILQDAIPSINAAHGYSSPQLREAAERCLDLAESLGRADEAMDSAIALWASTFVRGEVADSHRIITRVLDRVTTGSEMAGQVHFAYAGSAQALGRIEESLQHFDLAREGSRGAPSLIVGSLPEVHARAWSAHALWLSGKPDRALSAGRDAITLAEGLSHPYSLTISLAYGAITFQMCGAADELRGAVARLAELCERYGFVYYREWGEILGGWQRGDAAGLSTARRGIDRLRARQALIRMPYWHGLVAELLTREGQVEAACSTLDAAVVDGRARQDMWWVPELMRQRAAHDAPDEAVARLEAAHALARGQGSLALVEQCRRSLAARTSSSSAS